jgi:hypothetical protein
MFDILFRVLSSCSGFVHYYNIVIIEEPRRGRQRKYKTDEERDEAIRLYGINYRRKLRDLEPLPAINYEVKRGRPRKYETEEEAKEVQQQQMRQWQLQNKEKWRSYMRNRTRNMKEINKQPNNDTQIN